MPVVDDSKTSALAPTFFSPPELPHPSGILDHRALFGPTKQRFLKPHIFVVSQQFGYQAREYAGFNEPHEALTLRHWRSNYNTGM
jgi:hypothetical protein